MSYNNNYNRNNNGNGYNQGGYNQGGYNQGGYNQGGNNRNYNNQQQQQPVFKRSGVTYSKFKRGKFAGSDLECVNAWRKTKYGLVTASAQPLDGAIHIGKEKGHEFLCYVVKVVNHATGGSQIYTCTMRMDTRKIVLKDLGWVISPNGQGTTRSGKRVTGFFGKNHK